MPMSDEPAPPGLKRTAPVLATASPKRQSARQIWGVTLMKTAAIAGFVVLASTAAFAQSGGQLAVQQGTNTQNYDVPAGSKPQTVIITTRDLKDGETTSPHMHFGVEMTQVVTGTFECYLK